MISFAGDGNLAMLLLNMEINGEVANRKDRLLHPPNNSNFSVFNFQDKAYGINRATNGMNLTYNQYYDVNRQGCNPNSRGLLIQGVGGHLLDPQLRNIPNPTPARGQNGRTRVKLTWAEAQRDRIVTKGRWPVETANSGIKSYRLLDDRKIDTKYFGPIGEQNMQGFGNTPKAEILVANVCSLYNQNHQGFGQQRWPLPTGMTRRDMGRLFYRRSFEAFNPFCFTENVVFDVNLNQFPPNNRRIRNPQDGWADIQFDNRQLGFPQIPMVELGMLFMGSYHIKIAPRYLADMRYFEKLEEIEVINQQGIPIGKEVYEACNDMAI